MANPDDHIVLPEIISKEPLGPAVRKDDIRGSRSSSGRITRSSPPRSSA